MDISVQYIKMCEGAEEILDNHIPERGDWYISGQGEIVALPEYDRFICDQESYQTRAECDYLVGPEDSLWLPRQDQLQEISGLVWRKFDEECHDTYIMKRRMRTPSEIICNPIEVMISKEDWDKLTKEQIGLEVVMKERCRKIWNGEDWIKEETTK